MNTQANQTAANAAADATNNATAGAGEAAADAAVKTAGFFSRSAKAIGNKGRAGLDYLTAPERAVTTGIVTGVALIGAGMVAENRFHVLTHAGNGLATGVNFVKGLFGRATEVAAEGATL